MIARSNCRKIVRYLRDFTLRGLIHYCWLKLVKKDLVIMGSCNCCGNCCRSLSLDGPRGWLRSKKEFSRLAATNPEFERFEVTGRDSSGYLLFRCGCLGEDGLCTDYTNRPFVCLDFPHKTLPFCGGTLPPGCGYNFVEIASFHHVLQKKMKEPETTQNKFSCE